MQHHFESNLVAVEESGVAALQDPDLAAFELFSGPRGNFMYYWYASLSVVVQGFRNLKLVDPRDGSRVAMKASVNRGDDTKVHKLSGSRSCGDAPAPPSPSLASRQKSCFYNDWPNS
jgi:hypothetical protein